MGFGSSNMKASIQQQRCCCSWQHRNSASEVQFRAPISCVLRASLVPYYAGIMCLAAGRWLWRYVAQCLLRVIFCIAACLVYRHLHCTIRSLQMLRK